MWIKNAWYVAAWASEVKQGEPLGRTYLDTPIVLYRQESDDTVVAMLDMCPHRFAPMSLGKVEGDDIVCMYHGLEFNGKGKCSKNPLGPKPAALKINTFTTYEQDSLVWIWMGDNEPEDMSVIPRIEHHHATDQRWVSGYTHTKSDYRLFIDNLMDLGHTYVVHPDLGGKDYVPKVKSWNNDDGTVVTDHLIENMANFFDRTSSDKVTHNDRVTWVKPATHLLVSTTTFKDGSVTRVPSAHILTPEKAGVSHYFWSSCTGTLDPDFDETMLAVLNKAFNTEDKPIVEGVQRNMGNMELWDMNPVLLSNDSGMVRARRKLEQFIKEEK